MGPTGAAPSAVDREEGRRAFGDEFRLLFGAELQIAVAFLLGCQRGEDPAADAEVGVAHVGAFFNSLQAESDTAKVVGSHGWIVA
jgi:hypothetical protein